MHRGRQRGGAWEPGGLLIPAPVWINEFRFDTIAATVINKTKTVESPNRNAALLGTLDLLAAFIAP